VAARRRRERTLSHHPRAAAMSPAVSPNAPATRPP
jgi:hypothetical protein